MEEESKDFISIKTDVGEKTFKTIEEFEKWFLNEKNEFSWLLPAAQKNGNLNNIWQPYSTSYGPLQNAIQLFKNNESNQLEQDKQINIIHRVCEQAYKTDGLISSESANGKFVINLANVVSGEAAAFAMAILQDKDIAFNNTYAQIGSFFVQNYIKGDTDTVNAASNSLEEMKKSWAIKFGKFNKNNENERDRLLEEIDSLRTKFESLQGNINTLHESQENEFETLITESSAKLSDIETTFEQKLALQSSVSYWTTKRKHHTTVMWVMGGVTLISAVVLGFVFLNAIEKTLTDTIATTPLWKFGFFAAISTFGIWLVRLFSKIFISNLHLRTDADERVTMMQTYLAMLKEGAGPSDDERKIILEVLFRHGQSGFIKDDGPMGISDLLTKIINRKP